MLDEMRMRPIPLGISNRHIHLSQQDYDRLFPGMPVTEKKPCCSRGQFAAEQTVTLAGPKGQLHNVRLLGPLRSVSQWKSHVPMRARSASPRRCACPAISAERLGVKLISPWAEIDLDSGLIVALRHIHMSPLDALVLRVAHGDTVSVVIEGSGRRTLLTTWRCVLHRICASKCISTPMKPMPRAQTIRTLLHTGATPMTDAQMQQIVELIVARLQARSGHTAVLSQGAVAPRIRTPAVLHHDRLQVECTDLPFLRQLAEGDRDNTAVANLFEALSLGMPVCVSAVSFAGASATAGAGTPALPVAR